MSEHYRTYAIAKHDYTGEGSELLSFKKGQKILLFAFNKDEDWWEGQLVDSPDQRTGWFPKVMVEKLARPMKLRDAPVSRFIRELQEQAFPHVIKRTQSSILSTSDDKENQTVDVPAPKEEIVTAELKIEPTEEKSVNNTTESIESDVSMSATATENERREEAVAEEEKLAVEESETAKEEIEKEPAIQQLEVQEKQEQPELQEKAEESEPREKDVEVRDDNKQTKNEEVQEPTPSVDQAAGAIVEQASTPSVSGKDAAIQEEPATVSSTTSQKVEKPQPVQNLPQTKVRERKRTPLSTPTTQKAPTTSQQPVVFSSRISVTALITTVFALWLLITSFVGLLNASLLGTLITLVVGGLAIMFQRKPLYWVFYGNISNSIKIESFVRTIFASLLRRRKVYTEPANVPQLCVEVRQSDFLTNTFLEDFKKYTGIQNDSTAIIAAAECQNFLLPTILLTHPDFPYPAAGSVHVRTSIKILDTSLFERFRRGASLTRRSELVRFRPVKKGTECLIITRTLDGNEVVVEDKLYVLAYHKYASEANREHVHPVFEEDYNVPKLCTKTLLIPADAGRRYAALCGDYNPIHLHSIPAKVFGFKKAIAHGMWVVGRVLANAEEYLSNPVSHLEVFFRKPIFLPSQLRLYQDPSDKKILFIVRDEENAVCINGSFSH